MPTSREWLVIYLTMLAGVGLLWNRGALPEWLRPELQTRARPAAFLPPPVDLDGLGWWDFDAGPQIILNGAPTLVVGDSMVYRWPTDGYDLMSWPGLTLPETADAFAAALGERRYDRIVIWAGTHDLGNRLTPRSEALAAYDCLAQVAWGHARDVQVVQPCGEPADTGWVPYTVPTGWLYQGPPEWFRRDGRHLSPEGFDALIGALSARTSGRAPAPSAF